MKGQGLQAVPSRGVYTGGVEESGVSTTVHLTDAARMEVAARVGRVKIVGPHRRDVGLAPVVIFF